MKLKNLLKVLSCLDGDIEVRFVEKEIICYKDGDSILLGKLISKFLFYYGLSPTRKVYVTHGGEILGFEWVVSKVKAE